MNLPSNFTHGGWVDNPVEVDEIKSSMAHPFFATAAPALKESGRGKIVILTEHIAKVLGAFPYLVQDAPDCVSFGTAYAILATACADILIKKQHESLEKVIATEDIYGGSRMIIGKGRLGSGGGSLGIWAMKYAVEYGVLLRQKYGNIDLTTYSGARANTWGRNFPKELVGLGKSNTITAYSAVTNYEECIDSLANGYGVIVCSNQGFSNKRDSEGFLKPSGSWAHCMAILGFDDSHSRKGVLVQNSWPRNWCSGPKRHNQPDGSFWCDADVITRMLRGGDSWSVAGFEGYAPKEVDISIAW